jgi:hypothetical protein
MSPILLCRFLCALRKGIYSHKWWTHSILHSAPRVKQPAHHFHTSTNSQTAERIPSCSHISRSHRAVELDRFPLAAGGGERSAPNIAGWFLFSFILGFAFGSVEPVRRVNVIRNSCKCCRAVREPAVPICTAWKMERNNNFLINTVIVNIFNTKLFI